MQKKLVVGFLMLFLLLMAGLSVRSANNPEQGKSLSGSATIAVIEVSGPIGGVSNWMDGTSSAGEIMQSIRKAREREDVKAVVLRVDSPGGTSGASQEIAIELDRLRESGKPVITSIGDMCASGGYWIACSTDHIMANGTSLTGSIGVIMQLNNLEGLYDKLGIRNETIKSGEHKDIGSTTRDLTSKEKEMLQDMVDDSYQQFLEQVKNGRKGKIEENKLIEISDGRIFTGRQALELGLVDSLGNYYDAVTMAEKLSGIKGKSRIEVLNSDKLWDMLNFNLNSQSLLQELKTIEIR